MRIDRIAKDEGGNNRGAARGRRDKGRKSIPPAGARRSGSGDIVTCAASPAPLAAFRGILAVEIRCQLRSGLSALYLGMPLFWILIIRLLPDGARPAVALIGAYTDPVMMGQIFVGAFLTRERDQGLLEAWAVSPIGPGTWLTSRILLIGLQGSLGGLILAAGAGVPFRIGILIPGVFLAAAAGGLIGIILARPFRDILSYFVLGGIGSAVYSLPILGWLVRPSLVWLIPGPAAGSWAVMASAFGVPPGEAPVSTGTAMAALVFWTTALFLIARRIFLRGFFRRPGTSPSTVLSATVLSATVPSAAGPSAAAPSAAGPSAAGPSAAGPGGRA